MSCSEVISKINRQTKAIIVSIVSVFFVLASTFYYGGMGDYYSYEEWFNKSDFSHIYDLSKYLNPSLITMCS